MPAFPHHLAYTSPYSGGSTELSYPGNHCSGETASVKDAVAQGVPDRRCPDIRQSPPANRPQSMRRTPRCRDGLGKRFDRPQPLCDQRLQTEAALLLIER